MTPVAVVIPTWNRRELVRRAVDSALAQSGAAVELVVVDDGSTDGTVEALRRDSIACLSEPHRGRSAARNAGLRATSAGYVLFLDSDDTLAPGALASMASVLDARPEVDVVVGEVDVVDDGGRVLGRLSPTFPRLPLPLLDVLVLHNVIGPPLAAMVRRAALEPLQPCPFDETLHGGEDRDLWVRLAAAGRTFQRLDAVVGRYMRHDQGESSPHSPNRAARARSIERRQRKILDAPFFPALSAFTRRTFFWEFLTEQLKGRPDDQRQVVSGASFQSLLPRDRASILRHVAIEGFVAGGGTDDARRWLRQSVAADPASVKSLASLALMSTAPSLWRRLLERRRARTS
jgi:glycosyltransferase involved in cell wall biosynthesis